MLLPDSAAAPQYYLIRSPQVGQRYGEHMHQPGEGEDSQYNKGINGMNFHQ